MTLTIKERREIAQRRIEEFFDGTQRMVPGHDRLGREQAEHVALRIDDSAHGDPIDSPRLVFKLFGVFQQTAKFQSSHTNRCSVTLAQALPVQLLTTLLMRRCPPGRPRTKSWRSKVCLWGTIADLADAAAVEPSARKMLSRCFAQFLRRKKARGVHCKRFVAV